MLSFPDALVPFMTEMAICGVIMSHQLRHVIGLPVCLRNVLPLNSWTNLMNMQKEHLMPEPQIKQTNKQAKTKLNCTHTFFGETTVYFGLPCSALVPFVTEMAICGVVVSHQ